MFIYYSFLPSASCYFFGSVFPSVLSFPSTLILHFRHAISWLLAIPVALLHPPYLSLLLPVFLWLQATSSDFLTLAASSPFISTDLGRLGCLECDIRRDPDPLGLLPLSPDLLLVAALLLALQIHPESAVGLLEACRSLFWLVSQSEKNPTQDLHREPTRVPLTPQREEEFQAILHVSRQSWTDQTADVTRLWARLRVSQQERSWNERTAQKFVKLHKLTTRMTQLKEADRYNHDHMTCEVGMANRFAKNV